MRLHFFFFSESPRSSSSKKCNSSWEKSVFSFLNVKKVLHAWIKTQEQFQTKKKLQLQGFPLLTLDSMFFFSFFLLRTEPSFYVWFFLLEFLYFFVLVGKQAENKKQNKKQRKILFGICSFGWESLLIKHLNVKKNLYQCLS